MIFFAHHKYSERFFKKHRFKASKFDVVFVMEREFGRADKSEMNSGENVKFQLVKRKVRKKHWHRLNSEKSRSTDGND